MKIAVLGAGAWGTALATHWSPHHAVSLWGRDRDHIHDLQGAGVNARYLPGIPLPASLTLTGSLDTALQQTELAILAVTSGGMRPVMQALAERAPTLPLVWVCKGFEPGTRKLPHQVIAETLPGNPGVGVLSGPSFAEEVAKGYPTALTLASHDPAFARAMAETLSGSRLRIYANDDVIGVEVGGAIKNVMAIAAGICDGLALGHNARAALVTRGLAEMTRLGVKLGGSKETFMGLSGLGDLILTATGDLSRNRQVGLRLARGQTLDTILSELGHIAEGVTTAREVATLAAELGVDMPITHGVCQMLFEGLPASQAVEALLNREIKAEF
jgi:glycerol-3-phosphate dehydrogenase (NAD(P)+)